MCGVDVESVSLNITRPGGSHSTCLFDLECQNIRYDPQKLDIPFMPIFIYYEDKKAGEAVQVNYHDNARMKQKGRPKNMIYRTSTLYGNIWSISLP